MPTIQEKDIAATWNAGIQLIYTLTFSGRKIDRNMHRTILNLQYALSSMTNLIYLLKAEHRLANDWQLNELWQFWEDIKPLRDHALSLKRSPNIYTFVTYRTYGISLIVWKTFENSPLYIGYGERYFTFYKLDHHTEELYTLMAPMTLIQWLLFQIWGTALPSCGNKEGAKGLVRIHRDKIGEVRGLWVWWDPIYATYYERLPFGG